MEKRIELTSLFKAVLFIILLYQLSLVQLTFAQRSEPSKIVAFETDEQIRIDGRLDEQSWSRAQCISNFTQRELDYGEPATERTEVAILFDTDALYVGFWGYDKEPRGIRANEMARDFVLHHILEQTLYTKHSFVFNLPQLGSPFRRAVGRETVHGSFSVEICVPYPLSNICGFLAGG